MKTINERLVDYKYLLAEMKKQLHRIIIGRDNSNSAGFCFYLDALSKKSTPYFIYDSVYEAKAFAHLYPELWSYRPEDARCYWWSINEEGTLKRIEILKKVIIALEEQIRNESEIEV